MQGLYPIIRRVRRPLIAPDAVTDSTPKPPPVVLPVEPVPLVAETVAAVEPPIANHEKVSRKRNTR